MNKATAELHCEVMGAGPDLALLHPVGLDHTFMGPFLTAATRGHRVIAIDLRGHGRSPAAEAGTSFDDYVADIRTALARHCAGPATVVGLSFGGMLAQELALTHPDAVNALVLCGCPGGFAPESRPVLRERGLAAQREGMAAVVETTIERWFNPDFRAAPDLVRVRERLLRNDVTAWSAAWHAISTFDARARLGGINVPTLVVAGERDVATPIAATTALAEAIPGARLAVVPGAPHMMQIESTVPFNEAVGGFLATSSEGVARGMSPPR